VLGALPADLPAYLFVVQHIHPRFTPVLARRLGERSALSVREACDGELPRVGTAYLAPGGSHLRLERSSAGPVLRLSDAPACHGVRPCLDMLFGSVAEIFRHRAVAVVLTGMGRDGLAGCRAVRARRGVVLAEAEESCTVFGMSRAPIEAGLVDRVVPLGGMAEAIREAVADLADPADKLRRRIARRAAAGHGSMAG
jgi:two-component system chemotaxis response regulator CheB